MLKQIIEHLTQYPEGKIEFKEPIEVAWRCNVWGVLVNKLDNGVYLLCSDGFWHQLEETDQNYESVASAIKERLMPVPSFDEAYGNAF